MLKALSIGRDTAFSKGQDLTFVININRSFPRTKNDNHRRKWCRMLTVSKFQSSIDKFNCNSSLVIDELMKPLRVSSNWQQCNHYTIFPTFLICFGNPFICLIFSVWRIHPTRVFSNSAYIGGKVILFVQPIKKILWCCPHRRFAAEKHLVHVLVLYLSYVDKNTAAHEFI